MSRPCRACSLGWAELRRLNADLLGGMHLDEAAKKWGLSVPGVSRHRMNHLDRGIRRPERIEENRTAADVLVGTADRLHDLTRIFNHAMEHGNTSVAIRVEPLIRTLEKSLFSEVGLDSTASARWLADLETFAQATYWWARQQPGVLDAIADHVRDNDEMVRDLRSTQADYDTARQMKEHA